MKLKLICFVVLYLFVTFPTNVSAGYVWTEIQPAGDLTQNWSAVASDDDGSNLIAAVNGGRLYLSSDGGANWIETQPSGDVNRNWSAVASDDDGSNLIAAVSGGRALYISVDAGETWNSFEPLPDQMSNWSAVASDDDGSNLIAAVNGGRLYLSSDGGANWIESQPVGDSNALWGQVLSDADGSFLVAVESGGGEVGGRIYTSSDSGANWIERQPAGDDDWFWRVAVDADGSNLIAGTGQTCCPEAGGRIYTSSDSGANWIERQPAGNNPYQWNAVASDDTGTNLLATVDNGRVYSSTDGGISWSEEQPDGDIDNYWRSYGADMSFDGTFVLAFTDRIWSGLIDTDSPVISTIDPEDNATDILVDIFNTGGATITFNESVYPGTGFVTIYDASDDSIVATFNVEDSDYVSFSDNEVYLATTEETIILNRETDYYILIDSGAFEDGAANPFAGISDSTTWNFTTVPYPTVLLDETFTASGGFNNNVYALALQEDGKIVVGGSFNEYNGSNTGQDIARLNPDGTLDETFTAGDGFYSGGYGTVYALTLDTDNKIIVGGNFTEYDNVYTGYAITRLNPDGTLDETFTTGDGFDGGQVYALALQPDGKIVVGGSFSQYDGDSVGNIARLNPDGTLDETFTTGGGFNNNVYALALQEDGKIVVGGSFNEYDGSTTGQDIARLNPDGTLDETFTTGTGFDTPETIYTLVIQDDGKIIAGGDFASYGGDGVNNIARLNPDGTLDETFTTGDGFSSTVRSLALQEDGKIVVGGSFYEFDGSTTGQDIARLNPDGTLDETFTTGDGFNTPDTVYAFVIQDDGKIIAGGDFTAYDGDDTYFIARLIPPIEEDEETSSGSSNYSSRPRDMSNRTLVVSFDSAFVSILKQFIVILEKYLESLKAK